MTKIPGEPLGELIADLDGSDFTHSGIALGHGRIASSRTSMWCDGRLDIGGIRHDDLTKFWRGAGYERSIYRLAVPSEARREEALRFVAQFPPHRDGAFSFVKLFLVAAALHASDPRRVWDAGTRERLLARARVAGRAWTGTRDYPRFYCAEFVATAFRARFRVSALPTGPVRPLVAPPWRPVVAEGVLERLLGAQGTGAQEDSLRGLLRALREADPGFLTGTVLTLAREAAHVFGHLAPALDEPAVSGEDVAPRTVHRGLGRLLPRALVTPRMLRDAAWTGPHLEVVERPE